MDYLLLGRIRHAICGSPMRHACYVYTLCIHTYIHTYMHNTPTHPSHHHLFQLSRIEIAEPEQLTSNDLTDI